MVLKRKLIEELLKSSQWASKLEKARSFKDAEKVIVDFARSRGFKININEDITLNTPSDFYAFNKYLDVSYTVKKNESLNYYFIAPYLKENESFRDYYFVWRIKAINISPSATSFSIFSVRVISLEWKTLIQDDDFWQTLNQLRDDVLDWQTKYYDLWLKYSSRSEQVSDLQKEFYELAREHYKLTRQYRLVLTIVTSVAVFFFITSLILLTIVFRRLKK